MTILYSCVARGTTVLCSDQPGGSSYSVTIGNMLDNISHATDLKKTFTAQNNDYHCLIENGIIYVCVTDTGIAKTQPFNFLNEVKRRFTSGPLIARARSAGPGDLDPDFSFVLSQQMKNFSKSGSGAVSRLQTQIDEVKGVMTQNIEKVIERGERLDDLMDKTEELEATSANFQRTSRKIAKRYWWRNKKMTIILVSVCIVVVLVIVLIILFSTGVLPPKSSDSSSGSTTPAPHQG